MGCLQSKRSNPQISPPGPTNGKDGPVKKLAVQNPKYLRVSKAENHERAGSKVVLFKPSSNDMRATRKQTNINNSSFSKAKRINEPPHFGDHHCKKEKAFKKRATAKNAAVA